MAIPEKNPIRMGWYRGGFVAIDTTRVLLSDPPKYNIQYKDGRNDYAPCHEVTFFPDAPASRPGPPVNRLAVMQQQIDQLTARVNELFQALRELEITMRWGEE